jgi:hypothetical protein
MGMFLSKAEVDRITHLARRGDRGTITSDEKGELRQLLAKLSPQAQDLAWPDLLEATFVFLGLYTVAEMAQAATADAS